MPDPSPTFECFWKDHAPGEDAALRLRHAKTLAAAVAKHKTVSKHVWEDSRVLENGDLNLPAGLSQPMDPVRFAESVTDKLRHLLNGVEMPWAAAARKLLDTAPVDWDHLLSALELSYLPHIIPDEENGGQNDDRQSKHWPLILVTAICLGASAWL